MQELKRVLLNWKFIGMLVLLLVVNGWYTYQKQQPDKETRDYYEQYYNGDYENDKNVCYLTWLHTFQGKDLEEAKTEIADFYTDFWNGSNDKLLDSDHVKADAYGILQEQIDYMIGYQDYIKGIKSSADDMKTIQAIGAEGSFSRRNIDKTVADFEKLNGIPVSLDNERGVNAYIECVFTGMLLMILALIVVMILLEERKKGLWQFVYSMPMGRNQLAMKRAGILCLAVTVGGILFEAENLYIIGQRYGGFGDLSRMVQSNPAFSGCVLPMKMGTFLALVVAMKILVCAFFGCMLWMAASSLKSHTAAFASIAVVLGAEYYAYTEISVQSSMNRWKFLNLFAFLDSGHVLTSYQNLNLFGYPIGAHTVLLYGIPVLLLLAVGCVTLLGRRRPFAQKDGLFIKLLERISYLVKPYRHNCHLLHECYKVFVKQRVALIIVLLVAGCILSRKSDKIFYDYETTLYNNYMEQIQGSVTKEKMEYLANETELWQQKIEESKYKLKRYQALLALNEINGDGEYLNVFSSEEELEKEKKKIQQYQLSKELVNTLISQGEKMQEMAEKGVHTGFVNRIGYDMYLGKSGDGNTQLQMLLMLAFLILTLSGLRSYESSQNADKFLKSMKRGRTHVFYRKCIVALMVTAIIMAAVTYVSFRNTYDTYGMAGFDMSVWSLESMEQFPVDLSLGQVIALIWVLRFALLYAVAMIIMLLSGHTKNMLVSILVSALVLLIPAGLVIMGFDLVSILSVLRPATVTYFWNKYGFENIRCILPGIVLAVIGITAFIRSRRESYE